MACNPSSKWYYPSTMIGFREDTQARSKSFYALDDSLCITAAMIRELIAQSEGKNVRLCLHRGPNDSFHQMLILEYRGKSFPAHRHPVKSEGYQIIRGQMDLYLYDDHGKIERKIFLNTTCPIARIGPQTFHALNVVTDYAIYLESKPGPFVREDDKVMAPWTMNASAA